MHLVTTMQLLHIVTYLERPDTLTSVNFDVYSLLLCHICQSPPSVPGALTKHELWLKLDLP